MAATVCSREQCTVAMTFISTRAVPDYFPIRPEPDFARFGMTNPAGGNRIFKLTVLN